MTIAPDLFGMIVVLALIQTVMIALLHSRIKGLVRLSDAQRLLCDTLREGAAVDERRIEITESLAQTNDNLLAARQSLILLLESDVDRLRQLVIYRWMMDHPGATQHPSWDEDIATDDLIKMSYQDWTT